jgi:hypothetical protein
MVWRGGAWVAVIVARIVSMARVVRKSHQARRLSRVSIASGRSIGVAVNTGPVPVFPTGGQAGVEVEGLSECDSDHGGGGDSLAVRRSSSHWHSLVVNPLRRDTTTALHRSRGEGSDNARASTSSQCGASGASGAGGGGDGGDGGDGNSTSGLGSGDATGNPVAASRLERIRAAQKPVTVLATRARDHAAGEPRLLLPTGSM